MKVEVAIIGGGPAGSAAAIELARSGRDVALLEREAQPQHKVCGEFLSYEAMGSLRTLGVEPAELGAAAIHAVRLAGQRSVHEAVLPFAAMSMTRRRLDEELLRVTEKNGVRVLRGTNVEGVERDGDGWRVKTEQSAIAARSVFVATGKHDLRGRPRPRGSQSGLVGFKMYFRLAPRQAAELTGHIELMVFRGGYGGLSMVEDGMANMAWLIDGNEFRRLGGRWETMLAAMQKDCPHMAARLDGAQMLLARPLAVSPIPYGYVREAAQEGVWAVGDQAAVIPSFTGDGMAIALHSGRLAAEMYAAAATAEAYQHRLHAELRGQVKLATAISKGLVWQASRPVLLGVVRAWPKVMELVARRTRIAEGVRLA